MNSFYIVLLIGVTVLAGCSVAGGSVPAQLSPTSAPAGIDVPREVISLSISLFLLVDDKDHPDPEISTHRTKEDLRKILEGMNDKLVADFHRQVNFLKRDHYLKREAIPNQVCRVHSHQIQMPEQRHLTFH